MDLYLNTSQKCLKNQDFKNPVSGYPEERGNLCKKRNQTGFRLLLSGIPMENVYRVFRRIKKKKDWDPMFRSPTRVRLMFEVSRKISSTMQGFKKIHRPVPFGIRNLEKYSRLSSREEANLRPESGEALYKKTKGECLLNRKI